MQHETDRRPTTSSARFYIDSKRISDKCAKCPARLDGTVLQSQLIALRESAESIISNLTTRQQQIMQLVIDGCPSKNIAADLDISQRTVENHRAAIMKKTGSRSIAALARLVLLTEAFGQDLTAGGARVSGQQFFPRDSDTAETCLHE